MRSFWSDPYLWIHLAGVAALPILLEICFLGLAVGDPILPVGLEVLLIAAIGIAPVLWMQWQRPFCIFSLLAVALKPTQLTPEQRKLLRLFKTEENRVLALLVPAFLVWVLWQLYRFAPIAADVTPFANGGRVLGLLVAAIAFLGSNLFLQVPVSVVPVLFTDEAKFAATEPYPAEQVTKDFTLLGLQVKRILPNFVADTKQPKPAAVQPTPSAAPSSAAPTKAIETQPIANETLINTQPTAEPDVEPADLAITTASSSVEPASEPQADLISETNSVSSEPTVTPTETDVVEPAVEAIEATETAVSSSQDLEAESDLATETAAINDLSQDDAELNQPTEAAQSDSSPVADLEQENQES